MVKKLPFPVDERTLKLLDEEIDAFVRALAVEAAREDHREAIKKAKRKKGGRPKKKPAEGR